MFAVAESQLEKSWFFFGAPFAAPKKPGVFRWMLGISWEYHGNVMGISWDSLWDVICFSVVFFGR